MKKQYKSFKVKFGKYSVGLPGGDSYNARTPRPIKIAGEIFILVSGTVSLVAAFASPPGWVLFIGGFSTLAGRFVAKCWSDESEINSSTNN
jgi:hypothetical protein